MHQEEIDLIIRQSLSNKDNLSVAIKVGMAYPLLRRRIFSEFLHELKEQVQQALGKRWLTEVEVDDWVGISVRSGKWSEDLGVGSDSPSGKTPYFWVARFEALLPSCQIDEALKSELDEKVGTGRASKDFAWWMYPRKYRDWSAKNALLEFYNKQSAAGYWKKTIIQIAEVVDHVVGPKVNR